MELTKNQIKNTKGIAILFMLLLHLFCTKAYEGIYTPLIFIASTPLVYYLALFLCIFTVDTKVIGYTISLTCCIINQFMVSNFHVNQLLHINTLYSISNCNGCILTFSHGHSFYGISHDNMKKIFRKATVFIYYCSFHLFYTKSSSTIVIFI